MSDMTATRLGDLNRQLTARPALSPAARALWSLFLVSSVLVTAAQLAAGTPEGETIIRPVQRFLSGVQQMDSWRPMQLAEQYLRGGPHERPVYHEMLDVQAVKFQYPLSSLIFTRLPSVPLLIAISWFSVAVVAISVCAIVRRSGAGTPLEFRHDDPAVGLALVGLTLSFMPVIQAYSLGQIQAWINALLTLAILAWVRQREDLAGVAVGLACLLKPTYLLIGVWAVARRRTRFLVPMLAVVMLGELAAVVAYGIADNVDYLHALKTMGRHGEAFYPNQSFNGFLNRLVGNGDSLTFDRHSFAPFHPVVFGGTLGAFVLLNALALWLPKRFGAAASMADFAIMMLTITMTSPIAWTHHYGVLLPILAATAPAMLMTRPLGRWTIPALFVCYVATSQWIYAAYHAAAPAFGILQSYSFLAALLILAMMYRSLAVSPEHGNVPALQA